MTTQYGPLVRLWGLQYSQLPNASANSEELKQLLTSIFAEALPFIKDVPASNSAWKRNGTKTYAVSTAPVELYSRVVPADALKLVAKEHESVKTDRNKIVSESWYLRRSVHEDAAKNGTATWDEFVKSFKQEHAETEKNFTPNIESTHLFQQWDCSGIEIEIDGDTWVDWTLKFEESVHKLPAPLTKRVFPVVQATASAKGRKDFLVVQVLVEGGPESEGSKGALKAAYTSVERVREGEGGIEWTMGTVSNARGVLPQWIQNLSVSGLVAKDVSMFLEWMAKQRKSQA